MKKIVFTGGGSAGHITLNLALIPYFLEKGWQVTYIGSKGGMEEELVKKFPDVAYQSVLTGKLRRYFSVKNIIDMVKIPLGCLEAYFKLRKINPDIVFSKGGFVSFPVVVGAYLNRKKIFMHESDITPGLANKLSLPFVDTFFTTFEDTINSVAKKNKVHHIGPVLSNRLFNGDKQKGASFAELTSNKPVIMFIGGSLGAKSLNEAVEKNFTKLLKNYQIIHISGKNGFNPELIAKGYAQYEFVDKELKDLMALADIVVSRAGSNAIFELASLKKPMVLVPLPNTSSRGEQGLNAKNFQSKGYAEIIKDEDIANPNILLPTLEKMLKNKHTYIKAFQNTPLKITTAEDLAQKIMS